MKFSRIYHAVNFEPWLITPEGHAAIAHLIEHKMMDTEVIKSMVTQSRIVLAANAPDTVNVFGRDVELPSPTTDSDGITTIPVEGVISRKVSGIERACGVTDVDVLSRWIEQAESDPACRGMFFSYDTPGGGIGGLPELSEQIRDISKPNVGYTSSQCGSAGYWMGSQHSGGMFCSRTASVGSVGVFVPFVDRSMMAAKEGMRVDVLKNREATFKGAGLPGTTLSDDQRIDILNRVQDIFDMFSGDVKKARPNVPDSSMRGQAFMGIKAQTAGLVDGVMSEDRARLELAKMIRR